MGDRDGDQTGDAARSIWGTSCREKTSPPSRRQPLPASWSSSSNPAFAVDECLAAPNAPAPAGSHWYYRLERSTEHKCWYVREQRQETRAAPPKMRPTAVTPAPQATQTAVDQSTPIEQVERETQPTQPAWTPGEQTPTVAFVAQTSDAPASANAIQAEQSVADRPNAQAASATAGPDAAG